METDTHRVSRAYSINIYQVYKYYLPIDTEYLFPSLNVEPTRGEIQQLEITKS